MLHVVALLLGCGVTPPLLEGKLQVTASSREHRMLQGRKVTLRCGKLAVLPAAR